MTSEHNYNIILHIYREVNELTREKLNQLKEKLKVILDEVGHVKEIKQEIGKEFISRNLSAYRAMNVFMGIESLDTLNNTEEDARFLFIFSVGINKAIGEPKINIKEYFTNLEYSKWINYREEDEPENVFPLVFDDAIQLADNIWQTKITAQELYKLDKNNVFVYNFLTQRHPRVTSAGVQIDFDKRKSLEIKKRMLNGDQFPDHVKINILHNFQEQIHYDDRRHTLTIGENSIINTFDGHHRKVANSLAIGENPELDFTWGLIITNMSESEARDYMLQINKQKPIRYEQIKAWDMDRKENLVVSVIADDKISRLNRVMVEQKAEVKNNKGLTTKNIIAEAIKENYEIDDTTDIRSLGNWIIEFTDALMGLYPEAFITDPYTVRENSMINDENIFYGYIALSAKLYNNPEWKMLLKNKMESIDFDKTNPLWRHIGLVRKKNANKALRNKLYELFTEGVS